MALCTITATLKLPDGSAAAYGKLRVVRAVKTGSVFVRDPIEYTANSSGILTFTATQGATAYLHSNANDLNANGANGVAITVPGASTANLEDLI